MAFLYHVGVVSSPRSNHFHGVSRVLNWRVKGPFSNCGCEAGPYSGEEGPVSFCSNFRLCLAITSKMFPDLLASHSVQGSSNTTHKHF
jgi:hypothetical protein